MTLARSYKLQGTRAGRAQRAKAPVPTKEGCFEKSQSSVPGIPRGHFVHDGSVERIHLGAQARHDEGQRDGQPDRIRLMQAFDSEQESRRDRNNADDACNDNIGLSQERHIRSPIMVPGILPQLVTSGNELEKAFGCAWSFGLKRMPPIF